MFAVLFLHPNPTLPPLVVWRERMRNKDGRQRESFGAVSIKVPNARFDVIVHESDFGRQIVSSYSEAFTNLTSFETDTHPSDLTLQPS
ncbi:hypothetical protein GJAV_G00106090 [Gymnothorax javanicus]|nr:hypothetical protein GJAV_G00106090 [Gymnothorax javanicus]